MLATPDPHPHLTTSGKVIPMPRYHVPKPPADRFTLPKVREAWEPLQAVTIKAAAPKLWLTSRMMKHRRHDSAEGQFPQPIPVVGRYHQAAALYDLRLLELWARDQVYDLRPVAKEAKPIIRQVERAVKVVQPIMLTAAAAQLAEQIVPELNLHELGREAYLARAQRRLRNWRETWPATGFPPPLPAEADHSNSEMLFSMAELVAWLKHHG